MKIMLLIKGQIIARQDQVNLLSIRQNNIKCASWY